MTKLQYLCLALFACSTVFGQQGSISGTVQDPTGAILAKAGVKLTSKEQGTVRAQETNESGVYSFTILPQGTYDLEVSAQGFKTAHRTDLILSTGQNMRLDVSMEVGSVSDNVTVSANVESVNTETS